MIRNRIYQGLLIVSVSVAITGCKALKVDQKKENTVVPESYTDNQDTTNSATSSWKTYFDDQYLMTLIDSALSNNQELNITMQEIEISKNEIRARKGEYLPFLDVRAGGGGEKVGRYTTRGANEAANDIAPGVETPEFVPDMMIGAYARWEIDIWHKLRNAKKSAVSRYLASVDGKNFMVTNLIAEIANSYYELLALDNQLMILKQNIENQTNALKVVRLQKVSGRVTELAVRKFEASVLNTQSMQYTIEQRIIEAENRINFLVGRMPQHVERSTMDFNMATPTTIRAGIPAQLLENRPDIRQAEMELTAAKIDIKVARAAFYPSIGISAGVGLQAFDPKYFIKSPQSLLFSVLGDAVAPLINRNALKAEFYNANAKQVQAVYNYEQTILNAYIEVANQLSNIDNLAKSYDLKHQEVEALTESITISNDLFRSARADYMEVLMTQRDALESKMELVETKLLQMNAKVNIYRSLGGGWQ